MFFMPAYLRERDGVVGFDLVLLPFFRTDRRLAAENVEESIHVLQSQVTGDTMDTMRGWRRRVV